ncbi:hypothetical protein KBB41_02395 [Candidatus Curtissbacteria bacterium]|nr:hypothetical protein [Candidatus Curtissbacteria bacterium]
MKNISEIIVGLAVVIILVVFLNPTKLLMPVSVNLMLILCLVLVFLAFVGLIWKEKSVDERDGLHIQKSGRLSFLVGSTVLVIGVVVQSYRHEIDPWLIYGLTAMILTKLVARIFHNFKN